MGTRAAKSAVDLISWNLWSFPKEVSAAVAMSVRNTFSCVSIGLFTHLFIRFTTNFAKILAAIDFNDMGYSKSIKLVGSMGWPSLHNSKCRCGPVVSSPVFPTVAITSPAPTSSPCSLFKDALCL